jgi:iron complex transport system ATP-binding protein
VNLSVVSVDASYSRGPAVLHNVSFEAKEGAIVVLIGPNAAGKSTLLKAIAGLMEPTKGTVRVDGRDVYSMQPVERAAFIAWAGQSVSIGGRFTVREVVAMGRFAPGPSLAAVDEALAAADLSSLAECVVEELSVGQQQRVSLARVLSQVPARGLLVLDEPFAALDPSQAERAARLLRSRAAAGTTVVVAVHDVRLAWALGDDVLGLRGGEVVVSGAIQSALTGEVLEELYGIPSVEGPEGPLPALRL